MTPTGEDIERARAILWHTLCPGIRRTPQDDEAYREAAEAILTDHYAALAERGAQVMEAAELKRLRYDAHLGNELESAICMYTHFTGDPPYVGLKGLIRAIRECAEAARRHRRRRE